MPTSSALASARAGERDRLAVDQHLCRSAPTQHAEAGQQQFALALAVEPAEADDLARPAPRTKCRSAGRSSRGCGTSSTGRRRRSDARASAERRSCTRGRSSARRPRCRSWCRRRRSRRCGRCGRPCSRRQVPRSRACGARCRAAPAPRSRSRFRTAKTFATSAAVSADVASSRIRMRGLRASALAISTIWRRDSGRSLTSAADGCPSRRPAPARPRRGGAARGGRSCRTAWADW